VAGATKLLPNRLVGIPVRPATAERGTRRGESIIPQREISQEAQKSSSTRRSYPWSVFPTHFAAGLQGRSYSRNRSRAGLRRRLRNHSRAPLGRVLEPGATPGIAPGENPRGDPPASLPEAFLGAFSSLEQFSEPPLGSALSDPSGIPGALPGAFSTLESFPNSHAGEAQSNC
jgi:hypothetical protein